MLPGEVLKSVGWKQRTFRTDCKKLRLKSSKTFPSFSFKIFQSKRSKNLVLVTSHNFRTWHASKALGIRESKIKNCMVEKFFSSQFRMALLHYMQSSLGVPAINYEDLDWTHVVKSATWMNFWKSLHFWTFQIWDLQEMCQDRAKWSSRFQLKFQLCLTFFPVCVIVSKNRCSRQCMYRG